jgi:macrolide-specific efflux system membrane fusion protein
MKKHKGLVIVVGFFVPLVIVISILVVLLMPKRMVVLQEDKLQPRDLRVQFRVEGYVDARNKLPIKSPIAGRIEKILVSEGDAVKKGEIIFWMSSTERAAMVDAARAISEAEFKRWQEIYKPTPVVAPMDGFIIDRRKEPGQTITLTEPVLTMADDLIVVVNVDETDFRYVKIGDKVPMWLDAYQSQHIYGIIEHVAYDAVVSNNVIVYEAKIRPLEKPEVFRAGMTATAVITVYSKNGALSIPSGFITDKDGKKVVTVKVESSMGSKFKTKDVKTGISDGKYTEILSGLEPGQTVVVLGHKTKIEKKA